MADLAVWKFPAKGARMQRSVLGGLAVACWLIGWPTALAGVLLAYLESTPDISAWLFIAGCATGFAGCAFGHAYDVMSDNVGGGRC